MQRSSRCRGLALGLALTLLTAVPAAARPPYPDTAPDPTHPDRPHTPLFSPGGYGSPLPLLVIVVQISDAPAPENLDTALEVSDRIFTGRESITNYWSTVSGGRFQLVRARSETEGTAGDGVVFVDGGDTATYVTGDLEGELWRAIALSDPHVDYAAYDRDSDGALERTELALLILRPLVRDETVGGGVTRGPNGGGWPSPSHLDGALVGIPAAAASLSTNRATIAHEVGHAALDLEDWYGYGVGGFDIAGPTIDGQEVDRRPSGVFTTHLGWTEPLVVTDDRWLTLPPAAAPTEPDGVFLYDPGVGDHDYLYVENRLDPSGTRDPNAHFDGGAPDKGLVVYRVRDDRFFTGAPEHLRPIELVLPDGRRSPGCDDNDLDGVEDEDPLGGVVSIIDGRLDINLDGATDANDDGKYITEEVRDGYFDLGRAPTDPRDTFYELENGEVGSVAVIAGRVDVDGNGAIDRNDDSTPDAGDPWKDVDNDGDGRTDEDDVTACYGGTDQDAWDVRDRRTAQRSFEGRLPDGGRTGLAVRNMWPSDPTDRSIRFFADVRGPGVMVDTFPQRYRTDDAGALSSRELPLSISSGRSIDLVFTVRNTGDPDEAADTFDVRVDLPGWTSPVTSLTLAPGEERDVTLPVTPPLTHRGALLDLPIVARSTTRADVAGRDLLPVRVRAANREPDRFEYNDRRNSETVLAWDAHTYVRDPLGGAVETWSTRVNDLNMHGSSDWDLFHITLPAPTDAAVAGSSGALPLCGTASTHRGRLVTTETLEGRAIARGGPLRAYFAELRSADDTDALTHRWRDGTGAVTCVRDYARIGRPTLAAASSDALPAYDLALRYRFEVTVLPEHAEWIAEQEQFFGAGSVINFICPGGAFPNCLGLDGPQLSFDFQHLAIPGKECIADGCREHLVFGWPATATLDATFKALKGTQFELRDVFGNFVARAGHDFSAMTMSYSAAEDSDGGEEHETHRLRAPKLPAGHYVLVVTGPEGDVTVEALRPPAAIEVAIALPDEEVAETVTSFTRKVTVRNSHAAGTVKVEALHDEAGEVTESTCKLPFALEPGAEQTCTYARPLDGTPGDKPLEVRVFGAAGAIATRSGAPATLKVADTLPEVALSLTTSDAQVPDTGGMTDIVATIRNLGAETLSLERLGFERFDDGDGDGAASADERSELASDCKAGVPVAPRQTVRCVLEARVAGEPWSDPRFTASVTLADDEGNSWTGSASAMVDIVTTTPRRLDMATTRLQVRTMPVLLPEHDLAGLHSDATGDTLVLGTATVAPAGAAVLVSRVRASLGGAERECEPLDGRPVVVAAPTALRVTCHVTGELPEEARLSLSLQTSSGDGSTGVTFSARPQREVRIDVLPGSAENRVNTRRQGQLPVAVLTTERFDAQSVDAFTTCFGRSGTIGDCHSLVGRGRAEDVDGDGDVDLVLHFDVQKTGFAPADVALGCLTARAADGTQVRGCETVRPR